MDYKNIKRFDYNYSYNRTYSLLIEDVEGDWVQWDDVEILLCEIERLKQLINDLEGR